MDTERKPSSRRGCLNYPPEFKKRIAVASCGPGISVSKLALEYKLNANMVFKWRREYRAGLFDGVGDGAATLLPVEVVTSRKPERPTSVVSVSKPVRPVIEILIADVVIRVQGAVDSALLHAVLQILRA